MKCLGLFLLLVGPLFSQAEIQGPPRLVKYEANTIVVSTGQSYDGEALVDFVNYDYTITAAPNGDKTFTFSATRCSEFVSYDSLHQILIAVGEQNAPEGTHYTCTDLPYLDAISLAPVAAGLTLFYNLAPGMVAHNIVFKYSLPETNPPEQLSPRLTTVQPASPTNAQMILYDGLTNNIVDVDVTAGEILSQVTIPLASNVSIFGIRPTLTGAPTEVWAVSPPTGIFVVDESSASIAATIPVSIPPSSTPAGIVFSNDGSTAYEAVGYQSPDAS
jgi:hypothetical protein